jgi:hypothetical protein
VTAFHLTRAFCGLALSVFVGVWVIGLALQSRSVVAQRIEPHSPELAAALGELGTPIGTPQALVIFDERAFLGAVNPDGSRIVSERYLSDNGIYPLQWKTVEFVRNALALGSAIAAALFGLIWWRLVPRRSAGQPRAKSA